MLFRDRPSSYAADRLRQLLVINGSQKRGLIQDFEAFVDWQIDEAMKSSHRLYVANGASSYIWTH
jgi:hypothetical protein